MSVASQPILVAMPLFLALATFIAALLADAFWTRTATLAVVAGGLLAASAAAVVTAFQGSSLVFAMATAGGATAALSALVLALTALAVIGAWPRMSARPGSGRVAVLMAGAAAAAVIVIAAKDLLLLVIAIETLALAGYALVSSAGTSRSDSAANTYFVQGAMAAGLLLLGTSGVVAISGSTFMPGLAESFQQPASAATTAVVLIFAALVFKVGGFPLHSWVPDAYETADPAPAAYLASVPKVAALVVLGTLMLGQGVSSRLIPVAAVVAAASVAFGTIGGLRQTSYRRMLGYSAIAQTGFALTPLVAGNGAFAPVTLMALVYALATFGAFMSAEALSGTGWDGEIKGMSGIGPRRPVLAAALSVCLFSLTGIPLTAGFWGKFVAFSTAASAGYGWLAAVGVIGSVISFGYYGSVLKALWLTERPAPDPEAETHDPDDPSPPMDPATFVVLLAAAAVLLIGVIPFFTGSGVFAFLAR